MKNGFRVALIILGGMALFYAAFWLPHQVRLALWPRTEYQLEQNLIPASEPVWGPWLVVVVPAVLIIVAVMARDYIKEWVSKLLR